MINSITQFNRKIEALGPAHILILKGKGAATEVVVTAANNGGSFAVHPRFRRSVLKGYKLEADNITHRIYLPV